MAEAFETRRFAINARLPPVLVTPHDHRRLMRTAQELAEQAHPIAQPLLQELNRAVVCPTDQLPEDVVTLDTFVTYRLADSGRSERRALVHPEDLTWPPAELSVLTPLGLSLLGLRPGDRVPLIGSDRPMDACVEVVAVGPRVTGAFVSVGI
ncbi:MAG TPA: GreA/GreB family elongation factor [Microvirga sp.]|nr:GreA/GreB family elongation factor [Microvirga sp.]